MLNDKIKLLPDLTKVLIRDLILPIGIVKLQRIVKKNLKLKKTGWKYIICDDCKFGTWNKQNYLENFILIESCASPDCCYKYVCKKGCKLKCTQGHINKNFDSNNELGCRICSEIIIPYRCWFGISETEYNNR